MIKKFYYSSLFVVIFDLWLLSACSFAPEKLRVNHLQFATQAAKFQDETNHYQWLADTLLAGPGFIFSNPTLYKQLQASTKDSVIKLVDSLLKTNQVNFSAMYHHPVAADSVLPETYLTKNLNDAIETLAKAPWANDVSLADFCEYILPFRIGQEAPDYWRDTLSRAYVRLIAEKPNLNHIDSLYKYHMATSYYYPRAGEAWKKVYPADMNYSWLRLAKEGECQDRCHYVMYHLRAAAIPATYDYIPNWGNRPFALHAHVGLANRTKQVDQLINNLNNPNDTASYLTSAYMHKLSHVFTPGEMPPSLSVQYVKTIPKVYRQTWSFQPDIINLYNTIPRDQLYTPLIKPNMIDVSEQYLETAQVTIDIPSDHKDLKLAYLGVFDINGWFPVAYAKVDWFGKATFMGLGKNILYMPLAYKNEQLSPFGRPFVLLPNGARHELVVNRDSLVDMRLIRKFPFFSYTAAHAIPFNGCRIEAANTPDFKKADTLLIVNYYPFYMNQVHLHATKKYRYARLVASKGNTPRVAELAFYGISNGDSAKLTGKPFGIGMPEIRVPRAFDGDLNTYAAGGGLGIDFGMPVQITRVDFSPCSDTNNILPGNTYELFYWADQWLSAGKQTVNGYDITLKNVPSNTVYWLRCLDGGKEERTFTYGEKGQVWW